MEAHMPQAGIELQGAVIGGKYRLGRYLGSSERSAVFLTERKQGSPQVAAIKLIPANPGSAEAELSRLRLISKLSHPHLLQIFEVGRCQHEGAELLYVVMEYAEENLEQILGTRPLTEQETDEMLRPTLEALAFLHKSGFIHGHIQPANILVAGEQLKLSSDGICRAGERGGSDTGMYASPEQLETPVAPSKDIWSLGVTVVQALTQLLPVRDGENQAVTLPETLPPRFADLAPNCLELDPQRRCTLQEIAEHLKYKLEAQQASPVKPEVPVQPELSVKPELNVPAQAAVAPRRAPATPERPAYVRQTNRVPANRVPAPAPRDHDGSGNRYVKAASVLTLVLAMVFGGVKLLNRRSSQQQPLPVSLEQTSASATAPLAEPGPKLSTDENDGSSKARTEVRLKGKSSPRASLQTASEVRNVYRPSPIESSMPPAAVDSAPGKVIQQVLPEVSQSSMNTIHGTVRVAVRVHVDAAGNILGVSFIAVGPSQYFARLASDAAQRWKFSPPRRKGQTVASTWDLRFEFIRGATRVNPVEIP
jgi:TonB family protein